MEPLPCDVTSGLSRNPALEGLERVYFKESPIHRLGGFAKRRIRTGTKVIEYVGEKIEKRVSHERLISNNAYVFVLDDEFDLDGDVDWNPAKYINHSCSPNCESDLIDGRVWIIASRLIQPHEELTYNYGFDLDEYKDYPCRCGSADCVGYIVAEEFIDQVKKEISKNASKGALKAP